MLIYWPDVMKIIFVWEPARNFLSFGLFPLTPSGNPVYPPVSITTVKLIPWILKPL